MQESNHHHHLLLYLYFSIFWRHPNHPFPLAVFNAVPLDLWSIVTILLFLAISWSSPGIYKVIFQTGEIHFPMLWWSQGGSSHCPNSLVWVLLHNVPRISQNSLLCGKHVVYLHQPMCLVTAVTGCVFSCVVTGLWPTIFSILIVTWDFVWGWLLSTLTFFSSCLYLYSTSVTCISNESLYIARNLPLPSFLYPSLNADCLIISKNLWVHCFLLVSLRLQIPLRMDRILDTTEYKQY